MNELTKQAQARGIPFESSDSGIWIRYPCPHGGHRYIVRCTLADGYLAWCESEHPEHPDWSLQLEELLRTLVVST